MNRRKTQTRHETSQFPIKASESQALACHSFIHRGKKSLKRTAAWLFNPTIFNLMIAGCLALRYLSTPTSSPSGIGPWAFALAYWIGQLAIIGSALFILSFPIFHAIRNLRLRRIAFVFISTTLLLALILDTLVYEHFRFHINPLVFEMFLKGQGQVISLDNYAWSFLAFLVFAIVCVEFLILRSAEKTPFEVVFRRFLSFRSRMALIASIVVAGQLSYALADFYQYRPIVRLGHVFPLSEPLKMKSFFLKIGLTPKSSVEMAFGGSGDGSELQYPIAPIAHGKASKLNIVWIVVDTLRADMVNSAIMPNAFALSRQSLNYTNHRSGSNSTRHGIASMFYGIPGTYFETLRSSATAPVLMDEMRRQNYEMGIYASAPLTMPEFDQTVFSHVPNLKTISRAETDYGRDEEVLSEFEGFLDKRDARRPLFSFLFFDSLHQGNMPPDYPKLFQPTRERSKNLDLGSDDPLPYLNRYKNSANYIDSLIGKVLFQIRERGLEASTIVLLTSDHGEEFNDNGLSYWGHNSNFSDAQVRVPLMIHWPGMKAQDFSQLSSHFDIAPTLMAHALGVTNDPKTFSSGRDLFAKKDFSWIISGTSDNYAIIRRNDVTTVKIGSLPETTDHTMKPLDVDLDPTLLEEVFHEMRRFYKGH